MREYEELKKKCGEDGASSLSVVDLSSYNLDLDEYDEYCQQYKKSVYGIDYS